MHALLSYTYHEFANNWQSIVAFVGSGAGLSAVTQVVKKLRAWEKDATIQKFVVIAGLLGTAADWYLQNFSTHFAHATTPFVWFPTVTAVLFTLATFIHKYPVKQLSAKLEGYFTPLFQAASELRAESTPPVPTNEEPTPTEPVL